MSQASSDMHNLAGQLRGVAGSVKDVANVIPNQEILYIPFHEIRASVQGVANTINSMGSTAENLGNTLPAFRDSLALGLLTLLALGGGGIITGIALVVNAGAVKDWERASQRIEPIGNPKPTPLLSDSHPTTPISLTQEETIVASVGSPISLTRENRIAFHEDATQLDEEPRSTPEPSPAAPTPHSIPQITGAEGDRGAPSIAYKEDTKNLRHEPSGTTPKSGQSTLTKVGCIVLLVVGGAFLALVFYGIVVTYLAASCPSNSEYCREFTSNFLSPTFLIYSGIGIGIVVIGLVLLKKRNPVSTLVTANNAQSVH